MIGQMNMWGKDKVQVSIERIQEFEPPEGYYLAFSGGKDSVTIKALCDMAGVKYDAHYNLTTVDPPELVSFIKTFTDVIIDYPKTSMWRLIETSCMPPTRIVRYCCSELKEHGGLGRFVITGVRWAESSRRKNSRNLLEFDAYGSKSKKAEKQRQVFLNSDNDEKRRMFETCVIKGKHVLNPIIDWLDEDVWEFIREYKIPYCKLYDEGYERLGCIGCPMGNKKHRLAEFARHPEYRDNYLRAFKRMIQRNKEKGNDKFVNDTPEGVMHWWLNG